jgi:SAM-dependent methyltransferase
MPDRQSHWENVYAGKPSDAVSWFQTHAAPSLRLIDETRAAPAARLVDVGGGASPLAGDLVARGWTALTVLDIAASALEVARAALGTAAAGVEWVAADVLDWRPAAAFDLWHDRAVFHFLTEPEQRARYRETLDAALKRGGWLIMGVFAPGGPEACSGLPVQRWSAEELAEEFGPDFVLKHTFEEMHQTPWGAGQLFTWALFERLA